MRRFIAIMCVLTVTLLTGCYSTVDQGCYGRVKGPGGWKDEVHGPGTVTTIGRDALYQADATEDTEESTIQILVGGKVNLTVTTKTRYGLSKDPAKTKKVFEDVKADVNNLITRQDLYKRYIQMTVEARPQEIIGAQPDILTVVTNLSEIIQTTRKAVIDASKQTPVEVYAFEITNYDWPKTITDAQERLAAIELSEKEQEAQVRADLKAAEGQVQVEEAKKLVEAKKSEGIAEGIRIVREELQNCPEYLQWHTVRAMSEAANGPNNAFILFPYNMPGMETQVNTMVQTALLDQIRKSDASTAKNQPAQSALDAASAPEIGIKTEGKSQP